MVVGEFLLCPIPGREVGEKGGEFDCRECNTTTSTGRAALCENASSHSYMASIEPKYIKETIKSCKVVYTVA